MLYPSLSLECQLVVVLDSCRLERYRLAILRCTRCTQPFYFPLPVITQANIS